MLNLHFEIRRRPRRRDLLLRSRSHQLPRRPRRAHEQVFVRLLEDLSGSSIAVSVLLLSEKVSLFSWSSSCFICISHSSILLLYCKKIIYRSSGQYEKISLFSRSQVDWGTQEGEEGLSSVRPLVFHLSCSFVGKPWFRFNDRIPVTTAFSFDASDVFDSKMCILLYYKISLFSRRQVDFGTQEGGEEESTFKCCWNRES